MSVKKWVKKPVVIEAVQWTGDNWIEIREWAFSPITDGGNVFLYSHDRIEIVTLEGTMYASVGDYIIKGVKGEFYPCKPDIFHATYKEA